VVKKFESKLVMINFLAWPGLDTSPRLTPLEVDALFNFTFGLAQIGQLNKGYRGACMVMYWQRLKQGE
jgi:hypothetical protein